MPKYTLHDDIQVVFRRIAQLSDAGYCSAFEERVVDALVEELVRFDYEQYEGVFDMPKNEYVALALGRLMLNDLFFGQERLVAILISVFAQFNRPDRNQPYNPAFLDGMHEYFLEVK